MGWEQRARGGRYYTRSRKDGGRVVREYVGGGLIGELAARQDTARAARRAAEAAAWRRHRATVESAEASLKALCDQADMLMCGTLLLAGYHQHHRGQWRRPRER
jgi:hypothetical protein